MVLMTARSEGTDGRTNTEPSSVCSADAFSLEESKIIYQGKGFHLKYLSLVLLTAQNAAYILSMRHVRTRGGDKFLATTAVIVQETIKCLVSMMIILVQEGGVMAWLRHLYDNIIQQPFDCLKISVPSLVYTLQNILIIVAVSNLDAATFQILLDRYW